MRVLTIDGMTAAALQIRLIKAYEQACPGFLRSVDCFVGASDGGYMALFLASRVSEDDEANLAMLDEAIAFSNALIPLFHLTIRKGIKFATGWFPLLCVDQFQAVFAQYLGTGTLGQLQRKVVICSFGAIAWTPVVYTNLLPQAPPSFQHRGQPETTLIELALATSAFPMALPLHGKGGARVIDGGWVATNPSMLGVSELCRAGAIQRGCDPTEILASLRVFSLGSTESLAEHKRVINKPPLGCAFAWQRNSWGWLQWVLLRPWLMLDMSLQGAINLADVELRAILPASRYLRVSPPLAEVTDGWRLLLSRPNTLIRKLDSEAARLVATPAWFQPIVEWIGSSYLGADR